MSRRDELEAALLAPNEDLSFEYISWLDLSSNHGKATLAKAVIALANANGGYVVIGYDEVGSELLSVPQPEDVKELTQDLVNSAIKRYAAPSIHVRMEVIENAQSGVRHPVVIVPSTTPTPVMTTRDCEGVLRQARVYMRLPGPRSEEPRTVNEWRELLGRCVQRSRSTMLDAIRAIVEGRLEESDTSPSLNERLIAFANTSRKRLETLYDSTSLPADAEARMPFGCYEVAVAFQDAKPTQSLAKLRERIDEAHQIKLTGWPTFLTMTRPEMAPYVSDRGIEAWVGRPGVDRFLGDKAAHSDFWRIVPEGLLYTKRGYDEDSAPDSAHPGTAFDLMLPIWRVGEALLFARRFASTFDGVEKIVAWVRWSGLEGRALKVVSRDRSSMSYDRISRTSEFQNSMTIALEQLDDNLPEVLHAFVAPVYEIFDFYELPKQFVERELEQLMRRG